MDRFTYMLRVKDPTGRPRRIKVFWDLPVQIVRRQHWQLKITRLIRKPTWIVDEVEWTRL